MPTSTDAAQTLRRWEEEEARARARLAEPGPGSAPDFAAMSGLQFLAAMLAGQVPPAPIGKTLDFLAVEADLGRAVSLGRPRAEHYNPIGSVHGGWIATLLDSCVGCAVHSALPAGKAYTTAELKINFVRPVTTRVTMLRAEGKVIHVGSRMATGDGRLSGPDGKLYAHASTTCFIFAAA